MLNYLLMQGELFLRVVLAAFCGVIIGYERMNRGKGAGIRTHLVVAAASALMMVVSKYGFSDASKIIVGNISEYRLDPSRLAAQIVSGVGFLGAGMIYIHGKTPHGLTTAAGIWATSGIGMAMGSGLYLMGLLFTLLLFISQLVLHKNFKFLKANREEWFKITIINTTDNISDIKKYFKEHHFHIENTVITRIDDLYVELKFQLSIPQNFEYDDIVDFVSENNYITEFRTVTN